MTTKQIKTTREVFKETNKRIKELKKALEYFDKVVWELCDECDEEYNSTSMHYEPTGETLCNECHEKLINT